MVKAEYINLLLLDTNLFFYQIVIYVQLSYLNFVVRYTFLINVYMYIRGKEYIFLSNTPNFICTVN